jgi:PAS domain S-box-containing protein
MLLTDIEQAQGLRLQDLQLAFEHAPVGLCVLRERIIQCCNQSFALMFGYDMAELHLQSMAMLYPSDAEFLHIGHRGRVSMLDSGHYADERIMRRKDGHLFWCHSSGAALNREDPYGCAVWMFEDISERRPVIPELTGREREIAQFLLDGKTSKQIAGELGISHRTIEAHRTRLMRKLKAKTPTEMVSRLARQA